MNNIEIFDDEFTKMFKCKNGMYNLNVKYQWRIKDGKKDYRIIDIKRIDPGFESFLIDEVEIINQIWQYFETL